MTAKPDALVSWVQGEARCEVEMPPQEGEGERHNAIGARQAHTSFFHFNHHHWAKGYDFLSPRSQPPPC